MDIICEHCGNSFSTKQCLKKHIEVSKYCSELRGEEFIAKYSCEDCGREFTTRPSMLRHRKGCEKVAEKEIDLLKMRIANLEALNRKLKKKLKARPVVAVAPIVPKKSSKFSSIVVDSLFVCTTDHVVEELNKGKFSMEDGIDGLVDFITMFIQKGSARCYVRTDNTRQTFFRYIDGKWTKDPNCRFFREILTKMIPFVNDWWPEYQKTLVSSSACEKYHRVIYRVQHGIIHPNDGERDVLIKEIVEKTSLITRI